MRRATLWAFGLIFWGLAACTLLSFRVEQAMTPQVRVIGGPIGGASASIPADCLFEDGQAARLYRVQLQGGWTVGYHAWELGVRAGEAATLSAGYAGGDLIVENGMYVSAATHPPWDQGLIEVVTPKERADDLWLAVPAEGGDLDLDQAGQRQRLTLLAQAEGAALFQADQAELPFMEKQAQRALGAAAPSPAVYSFQALEGLASQMPRLGLLLGVFPAALGLWGAWGILTLRPAGGRRMALLGLGAMLLALAALAACLPWLDLPASLLPGKSILDLGYYRREWVQIGAGLRALAGQGSAPAAGMLSSLRRAVAIGLAVFSVGPLLGAAAMAAAGRWRKTFTA